MTHRIPDTNGWIEIKNNPLSKAGVFVYKGIPAMPGAEPGQVYSVLRPEEELSNPETVASARLLPWTNDHPPALLGAEEEGRVPAEEKGVEGVTGEETYYKDGTLFGNIKVFSQSLADEIESGKTELSMGYACQYEQAAGVWNGMPYQYRQKAIRFNHLSLVDKGRMGADVAVLDSSDLSLIKEGEAKMAAETQTNPKEALKTAIDAAKTLIAALESIAGGSEPADAPEGEAPETKTEDSPESPGERIVAAAEEIISAVKGDAEPTKDDGEEVQGTVEPVVHVKPDPEKTEEEVVSQAEKVVATARDDKPVGETMDGFKKYLKHVATRDRLADALKPYVGTFDHADMTIADVAAYGVKKLGINAGKGNELPALQGYLQAKLPPKPITAATMDSHPSTALDKYLQGETK